MGKIIGLAIFWKYIELDKAGKQASNREKKAVIITAASNDDNKSS